MSGRQGPAHTEIHGPLFPESMTLRQKAARTSAPGASKGLLPLASLLFAGTVGLILIVLAVWAFTVSDRYALLAAALAGPFFAIVLYSRSLEASRLALTDELTGLGNGRRFAERLERDLERADVEGKRVALCLLDVDDFKRVNDGFGHAAGDAVLVSVAGLLRHGGEAFRLGGDEFALLLYGRDEGAALRIAEAVLRRVSEVAHGHGPGVTVSAGLAVFPDHETGRTELVRAADSALYAAKAAGKNCARAFRPELGWIPDLQRLDGATQRTALLQAARVLLAVLRAQGRDASEERAVADLAGRVAVRMGLSPEQVELIRLAGMLSDIGKLVLPQALLSKRGMLSPEEREAIERHPQIGHQILESLGGDPVANWVLHHHERWDGGGYPGRLAGERIPLGARILFVADAYGAMTTDQAWRSRLSRRDALRELGRCAGTQFDPAVVTAFEAELAAEDESPPAAAA
jgi:diguanylate cyclase (GGDEF)-like protein